MYASDEDMPMDEMMDTKPKQMKSPHNKIPQSPRNHPSVATYRSVTPTKEVSEVLGLSNIMAMVSPSNWTTAESRPEAIRSADSGDKTFPSIDTKGSVDSTTTTTGIQRMIAALNSGSAASRPANLNREECLLWDSFQTAMVNDRNEHISKRRALELDMEQKYTAMAIVVEKNQARKTSAGSEEEAAADHGGKREVLNVQLQQIDSLKQELQAKEALLKEQKESHESEVLAIQRVLADVTTEKMQLEESMGKAPVQGNQENTNALPLASSSNEELEKLRLHLEASKQETESARREAESKSEQIKALESDLNDAKLQVSDTLEENKTLKSTLESLKSNNGQDGLEEQVSHQKLETEKIKLEKMESQVAHASALEEVRKLKAENDLAGQEMEKLKQERELAVAEVEKFKQEMQLAQQNVEILKKEQEQATNDLNELRKSKESKATGSESTNTESEAKPLVSLEEFQSLQQKLSETTSSLETSKKIIASLESANSSIAVDSRSKLKEKEEEFSIVQKESEDRKRNLDSLATELRDLQRKQGDIEIADRRTKVQLIRQKALMDHLESTLNDLQAAVVVHESSVEMMDSSFSENSNIEEISEILGDALHAITATLETSEQFVDEVDDASIGNADVEYADMNIRNDRDAASQGLRHELDQKKVAVKRLEEALKKQNEEMRKMRSQFYNTDGSQMRTEIQRLRQQCTTNMEVLARKERELSVLRSSLNVDENESGYISDDASDEEDENGTADVGSIMSAAKLSGYGPADAEAYATILSQANGMIEMQGNNPIQQIETLKRDLMVAIGEKESASKELQARRESLANAKMIISSLEKSNKGMMEDLRSRLEDSNTAISSLLDKSKEHEKSAEDLREKLQKMEQERLEERANYEAELRKLRLAPENASEEGTEVSLEEKKSSS